MRNIFGWSYPPGCSSVPGDEPYYCEICGMVDDCCCPECPVCGEQGNKKCYGETNHENDSLIKRLFRIWEETETMIEKAKRSCSHEDSGYYDNEFSRLNTEEKEIRKQLKGHGLVITEDQIKSLNEAQDSQEAQALDEQMMADENWEEFVEYDTRDDRTFSNVQEQNTEAIHQ